MRIVSLGFALLAASLAFAPPSPAAEPDARRPKKLIAVGWDLDSDTAWIRQHAAEMEARPFDGILINVVGRRDDKKPCPMRLAFSKEPWKAEWFDSARDDLRACRFTRFTDNFLALLANPGDVDWFDDDGWRAIVEHWRIAARLAKQGGAKGIGFDPEPYYEPHAAFKYSAQAGRDRRTFEEYAAKARERGREVMKAVAAEYPDITILSFFLNSVCDRAAGRADPRPILAAEGYGLLPAFLDGWLDAAPPTVTLVDGHEGSYLYNSDIEFLEAANLIRGECQGLVSPENRAKYRAQVQTGFGIYLDAYANPPGSRWRIRGLDGSGAERLRANTSAAVRAADQYVWIYGEKCRWWPTPNKSVTEKTWPEALPGSEGALRFARDPSDWARWRMAELAKAGPLASLLKNGEFSVPPAKKGGPPPDWGAWQDDKSKGMFACDGEVGAAAKGSARLAGVADGCFIQGVKAAPGRRYAVEAALRIQGRGDALVLVRWQAADEKWTAEEKDVPLVATGPRGEWAGIFGVVEVPEGAGRLLVLLLSRGQSSAEDVAWFYDVRLYALDQDK